MKKEVKIILVSGLTITLDSTDDISIYTQHLNDVYDSLETVQESFEDIIELPMIIMESDGLIKIKHHVSTGEYMEYVIPREKITWCYYSEQNQEDKEGE